jgi:hypothetical protein
MEMSSGGAWLHPEVVKPWPDWAGVVIMSECPLDWIRVGMILGGLMGADSMRCDARVHANTEMGREPSSSRNCCIDGNRPDGCQPYAWDVVMDAVDRRGSASGWYKLFEGFHCVKGRLNSIFVIWISNWSKFVRGWTLSGEWLEECVEVCAPGHVAAVRCVRVTQE